MSPGVPHMGYTYLNLLDSPELLPILLTLTAVIKPLPPNFLGRAIVILNFVRRFRNFVLRVASGPGVKLVCFKSALIPPAPSPPTPVVYSTDRSKAVVLTDVVLTLCSSL